MASFTMTMDSADPIGPPVSKIEGVGELYMASSCTGPVACYGFLDTKDNGFWKIRVTGSPKTAITLDEARDIIKSVKRAN
jgi:hypothetical protein